MVDCIALIIKLWRMVGFFTPNRHRDISTTMVGTITSNDVLFIMLATAILIKLDQTIRRVYSSRTAAAVHNMIQITGCKIRKL